MNDEQIQGLVAEVIARVARRLGADGNRGRIISVFSGATVELGEALRQIRLLILGGYRVGLAFSKAAQDLYGETVRNQLTGFPHVDSVDPAKWLGVLREAQAIVVPLLSVNTLSKLSLLIADNLATNLILHALFMGKPVIVARNGADSNEHGREELGFHKGTTALHHALLERLRTICEYGCNIIDIGELSDTVKSMLGESSAVLPVDDLRIHGPLPRPTYQAGQRVVTAAQVTHAYRAGANLWISRDSLLTPLARDLASRLGVVFRET